MRGYAALLLSAALLMTGCQSSPTLAPVARPGAGPALALPYSADPGWPGRLDAMSAAVEPDWEASRNDVDLGVGTAGHVDPVMNVVEVRNFDRQRTNNGRVRENSYTWTRSVLPVS